MNCQRCDNLVRGHSKNSKLCWSCYAAQKRAKADVCLDCGGERHKTYKRCWPCYIKDNESKKCNDCKERNRDGSQPRCKPCRSVYIKTHKRYMQNCKLRGRYGLTIKDTDRMLLEQDYKCKACRAPLSLTADTHLDHDHATGAIRGILCRGCNMALGCVKDSKVRLLNLTEYLESYESSETTRLAPSMMGDDIVRPLWRHRESSGNDWVTSDALLLM